MQECAECAKNIITKLALAPLQLSIIFSYLFTCPFWKQTEFELKWLDLIFGYLGKSPKVVLTIYLY